MSDADDVHLAINTPLGNEEGCDKPMPHESLPADIWLAIFQNITQETVTKYRNKTVVMHRKSAKNIKLGLAVVKGPRSPIALSHVCHSWHSLATSYPPLWSNIFIDVITRSPRQMLDLWLKRSGSTGLSVWFDASEPLAPHPDVNELQEEIRKCLILLKEVSKRWTLMSFSVNMETWKICDDIFPSDCRLTMNLSRLETIEVAVAQAGNYTISDFIPRFYTPESNNLLNITIGDRFAGSLYDLPRISAYSNMPSVVSLVLGSQVIWQIHDLVDDLALLEQIETLEIYDCPTYFYGQDEHRNRTILPNLRKLTVAGWLAWLDTKRFLEVLSLPSLKEVTVAPKFEVEGLVELLAESGSRLNRLDLTLHPAYPDWSDLRSLLSSSSAEGLEEFILVSNCDTEVDIAEELPFFNAKGAAGSRSKQFPFSLISLTIIGWQSTDGRISQLGTTLFEHGSLRYLYVEVFPGTLDSYKEDYAAIRKWQRSGLDVDMRQRTLESKED